MVAKTAVAKKTTVKKSTEYTGTKKIENASAPAKDPRRVAAAKKARATIKAKAAAKLKKTTASKKGTKKAGKKGKKSATKAKGPKKPYAPSAFFIFSADNRAAIKKSNPSFKIMEIASELGKQWRGLYADKRKTYDAKAAAGKKKLGL